MACFHSATDYALSREQFGKPIAGFLVQAVGLDTSKYETTAGLPVGKMKDDGYDSATISRQMNNVDVASVARTARDIHGANGVAEYPIMRHMANLESVFTYEGTHDIHNHFDASSLESQRLLNSLTVDKPCLRVGFSCFC